MKIAYTDRTSKSCKVDFQMLKHRTYTSKFRVQNATEKVYASFFVIIRKTVIIYYLQKGPHYYRRLLFINLREKMKETNRGMLAKGILFFPEQCSCLQTTRYHAFWI